VDRSLGMPSIVIKIFPVSVTILPCYDTLDTKLHEAAGEGEENEYEYCCHNAYFFMVITRRTLTTIRQYLCTEKTAFGFNITVN
jgi:hypothetical protein